MTTPDAGQRRPSLPLAFSSARDSLPAQQAAPVEALPIAALSLDPPAAHHSPAAALLPLATHARDMQAAQPGVRGLVDEQTANHIAAMQVEARQANARFDSFDPAALAGTRDLLVRLGRAGEAIPLQRRILQFTRDGAQELPGLKKLAELYLAVGRPHEAIDAIEKARQHFPGSMMNSQTRTEIARCAVLARLLAGQHQKAREEMKSLGRPRKDDHDALRLQAMIEHAGGGREASETLSLGMQNPAHRQPAELSAIAVDARLPDSMPYVLTVLRDMNRHELAEIVKDMDVHVDDDYRLLSQFYRYWNNPGINSGVTLDEKGCQLLAEHFNRKYGTQIAVHASLASAGSALAELIKHAAGAPGDVRSSLNFGRAHGVCTVYIREAGKEALFLFDSIAESGETPATDVIRDALRLTGREIPVYRQVVATQTSPHGCFVQSMKTAVTLTRRVHRNPGEAGRFLIPNLISELQSLSDEASSLGSFISTTALPEIAKMTQSPAALREQLSARPDGPLRDSSRGLSLQQFVSAHSVEIEHGGKPVNVYDYSRQKGLRYAEIIEIEAFNQAILERVGPQAWSPAQQNEFAARVKALMHPRASPG